MKINEKIVPIEDVDLSIAAIDFSNANFSCMKLDEYKFSHDVIYMGLPYVNCQYINLNGCIFSNNGLRATLRSADFSHASLE
jgi:uncharacterized protein YjbI with pentapeptide repeats